MIDLLLELDRAFHHLSAPWQIATLTVLTCVGMLIGFVLVEAFASLMVWLRRRPYTDVVIGPECYHNTYCRDCERWFYTDQTCCRRGHPLLIYPDDPLEFSAQLAQDFPLPLPLPDHLPLPGRSRHVH